MEVARKGEESGYGVPCLLIAAKEDRDPYPMAVQDSMRVYIFSCLPYSHIYTQTYSFYSAQNYCKVFFI